MSSTPPWRAPSSRAAPAPFPTASHSTAPSTTTTLARPSRASPRSTRWPSSRSRAPGPPPCLTSPSGSSPPCAPRASRHSCTPRPLLSRPSASSSTPMTRRRPPTLSRPSSSVSWSAASSPRSRPSMTTASSPSWVRAWPSAPAPAPPSPRPWPPPASTSAPSPRAPPSARSQSALRRRTAPRPCAPRTPPSHSRAPRSLWPCWARRAPWAPSSSSSWSRARSSSPTPPSQASARPCRKISIDFKVIWVAPLLQQHRPHRQRARRERDCRPQEADRVPRGRLQRQPHRHRLHRLAGGGQLLPQVAGRGHPRRRHQQEGGLGPR
mmetsp:Transcript_626/g.1446  ORF Transcript_626/g.1446 Transcript_626/m.1446 type:complete len:323 (+) Transcript_626:1120-2088(+)